MVLSDQAIFQATLDNLMAMMTWIRKQIQKAAFSEATGRKIELAMEEAIVNVIRHAYAKQQGMIELIAQITEEELEFIIQDKGPPFNPLLKTTPPDPQAPLEEKEEGGLGLLFIQNYMDEVHYERKHPYNILTLIKKR